MWCQSSEACVSAKIAAWDTRSAKTEPKSCWNLIFDRSNLIKPKEWTGSRQICKLWNDSFAMVLAVLLLALPFASAKWTSRAWRHRDGGKAPPHKCSLWELWALRAPKMQDMTWGTNSPQNSPTFAFSLRIVYLSWEIYRANGDPSTSKSFLAAGSLSASKGLMRQWLPRG